jgi:hypothetical protein
MKGWTRSLFWEGLPFLMFVGVFGFIAVINWTYESKLFTSSSVVSDASNWNEGHLGQIMLTIAVGQIVLASGILFVVRLCTPSVTSSRWMLLPLTLVAVLLVFPSLFIVVLGPSAITMVEQERESPR